MLRGRDIVALAAALAALCACGGDGGDGNADAGADSADARVPGCSNGLSACDDVCVDLLADIDHCGVCGDPCGVAEVCAGGLCVLSCQDGLVDCDGGCIDPDTDREFCGASGDCLGANAGAACADGFVCAGQECALSCQANLVDCAGTCVDPMVNELYCGASGDCAGPDVGETCASDQLCNTGLCCGALEDNCGGTCADLDTDEDHCGMCGFPCDAGERCWGGMCYAASCAGVLATDPSAISGTYAIDPDGAGTFDVYCDMQLALGGWTLVAVITNGDANASWLPTGSAWVDQSVFGDATDPTTNADAKSPAFHRSRFDEVMIVGAPSAIEVRTTTGCLLDNTFSFVFNRNSQSDFDCAWDCATAVRAGPWTGQPVQANGLRFRCSDDDGDIDAHGYSISLDDNSFITTLNNLSHDFSFGFGAGEAGTAYADFDATSAAGGDASDTTPRLVYGR